MIKIDGVKVKVGQSIYLPKSWHEQVEFKSGKKDIPYQYTVVEEHKTDQKLFICEGSKNKKTYEVTISETVMRYLLGIEVPDSNLGFSFKEYFPL